MDDFCISVISTYCGAHPGFKVLIPVIEPFGSYFLLFTILCFNLFDR